MRLLSEREKEICQLIYEDNLDERNSNKHYSFLENLIDSKLYDVLIKIDEQKNVSLLYSPIGIVQIGINELIKRINDICIEIATTVNLIKMLEKDGYIMLLQSGIELSYPYQFGQGLADNCSCSTPFYDKNISMLLCEYTTKEIVVTEGFKQFCRDGYISREEKKYQEQILRSDKSLCFATSSLIVAIFALILNTIFHIIKP